MFFDFWKLLNKYLLVAKRSVSICVYKFKWILFFNTLGKTHKVIAYRNNFKVITREKKTNIQATKWLHESKIWQHCRIRKMYAVIYEYDKRILKWYWSLYFPLHSFGAMFNVYIHTDFIIMCLTVTNCLLYIWRLSESSLTIVFYREPGDYGVDGILSP